MQLNLKNIYIRRGSIKRLTFSWKFGQPLGVGSITFASLPLQCMFTERLFSSFLFSYSQSYLQTASDVPAGHSLDPSAGYNSPKFRSRNQSYMRAVSTLSQASCVSQVGNSLTPFSLGVSKPVSSQTSACGGETVAQHVLGEGHEQT